MLAIADDADYEQLGFMGHARVHTPNLDRLARTGTVFTTAYVPTSRCRASLASLLTGRWPHQHGVFYNVGPSGRLDASSSLPRLLSEAGYRTFLGGKFWEEDIDSFGFRAEDRSDEDTFVRTGQAQLFDFVRRHADDGPLFLWWAPMLPHLPHDPPARHLERVGDAPIEVPAYVRRPRQAEYRELERVSLAMTGWLDEGIGELVGVLEETGALERTLFCFLIDNGYANGLPSKGSPYEKGLRTPILVRAPGGAGAGRRVDALTSTVDLYPTLLDYAGLEIPDDTIGRSLRPWLEGGDGVGRDLLCGAVYAKRAAAEERPEEGAVALYARSTGWKYVRHLRDVSSAEQMTETAFSAARVVPWTRGHEALFDLVADPHERSNLAGEAAHAERLQGLAGDAMQWWSRSGGGELPGPPVPDR